MICNILIIRNHRPNEQQKYKQSKPIMDFSSSEYDTVQFSIKYLPGLLVSVQQSTIESETQNSSHSLIKERPTFVGAVKVGSFGEDVNYYLHHCLLQVSSISKKLLFQITIKVFATNFANKCCKNLSCAIMVFAPNYRTNRCQITEKRFPKHQNVPFFE